ncbi:MAG: PH domain-containing protein [Gemmatimonadetes bacterium]|nr:PH domain-containing protein [Gemmatimonadota bacterium]
MRFGAPWSTSVKTITILVIVTLGFVVIVGISLLEDAGSGSSILIVLSTIVMPVLTLIASAIWMIRRYVIEGETLQVQRLGWQSKLDLKELESVEVDPEAMDKSLRTFGVGGLFCFCGRFRNKKLGAYRAYATDPKRSVVMKFRDRTVVVSPDRPDDFVASVKERTGL